MTVPSAIFRAYDIRGIVETDLTPDVTREIGRAFGSECAAKGIDTVVVARDGRLSGPALITALTEGLMAAGRKVIDIGCVPTPVLYFATYHLETGTGIMVTGSHNPPEYNGLKMMIGGDTLFGQGIQDLYQRIISNDLVTGEGSREEQDLREIYLKKVTADISLERPLRIGVDAGNGVTGEMAPELFKRLGCEVVELFTEIDGNFPNHHPDPAKLENVEDLKKAVLEHKLDIGLAFDGDGDRVGVLDNDGNMIWPDRQMILYSRDVLSRNPGARIIFDVKCSRLLPAAIEEAGGIADMYKTGHSFIKKRIKETGAELGGEMSGHVFFKERWYGFDDALYAGARLLEIIAKQPRTVAEVFADIPNSVNTPELNINFAEGEHYAFMEGFSEKADYAEAKLTTIDGIRADFSDGWGLVRASNTSPSLVIRFEADNEAALERIKDKFRATMLAVKPDIDLPF